VLKRDSRGRPERSKTSMTDYKDGLDVSYMASAEVRWRHNVDSVTVDKLITRSSRNGPCYIPPYIIYIYGREPNPKCAAPWTVTWCLIADLFFFYIIVNRCGY
jgi:hypothetical protein